MIRSPSTHPDITKDPHTSIPPLATDGRTREIRMSPTLCVARQLHIVVDETTFLSFRGQVHVRPFIRKKLCLFPKEKEKEPLKKEIDWQEQEQQRCHIKMADSCQLLCCVHVVLHDRPLQVDERQTPSPFLRRRERIQRGRFRPLQPGNSCAQMR